jgi:hypothetical protein
MLTAVMITAVVTAPALSAASPAAAAGLGTAAPSAAVVARAIPRSDFLTQRQIRARLDLSRPLRDYYLAPTDTRPIADPDCATRNRSEATAVMPLPAARMRAQVFTSRVPGAGWQLEGQVNVYEYRTKAKARAALKRVRASVRSATRYSLVCEGLNPLVTGQRPTGALAVTGRSYSWRHHLRAGHAESWRHVVSTQGRRLVWVALGRVLRADLDWSAGTPPAVFPRYPSRAHLRSLAAGATAAAL